MQGGWPAWLQRLLPLAAGHRSGAVLRELLSAGVRPGLDAAAGMEAARAVCCAASAECLRLVGGGGVGRQGAAAGGAGQP